LDDGGAPSDDLAFVNGLIARTKLFNPVFIFAQTGTDKTRALKCNSWIE